MSAPLPRDGVWHANGLSADFRFLKPHPTMASLSRIETAAGNVWVCDGDLTWDPPRDLSPEAAAVIAKEKP